MQESERAGKRACELPGWHLFGVNQMKRLLRLDIQQVDQVKMDKPDSRRLANDATFAACLTLNDEFLIVSCMKTISM